MITKLKKIASLLTIILFIVSCNNSQNNSTKEKELAVKEKELMAKENSLLSKENELLKKEMQSNKDKSSDSQIEEKGTYYCSPLIYNPKVLANPDSNSVHPDWKGSEVGTAWSIIVSKKITNNQGVFLYGDLYSPRGGKMEHSPFYFIYSEWSCSK